jgi:hypothetical protein
MAEGCPQEEAEGCSPGNGEQPSLGKWVKSAKREAFSNF